MVQDSLYYIGTDNVELKHLGGSLYEIKGALVLFGDGLADADFVKDFFTANETDYDLSDDGTGESSVYFNHGLDDVIKKSRLGVGKATLSKDDKAVWIKHHLDVAENRYDQMVVELIQERAKIGKKFGFSSGVASHLVERVKVGGANKITRWPLGTDASITLVPNDWRQTLSDVSSLEPVNIKTLLTSGEDENPEAHIPEAEQSAESADDIGTDNKNTKTKSERKNLMTVATVTQTEHESVLAELKQFKDAENQEAKDEVKSQIEVLSTSAERLEKDMSDMKSLMKSFPRQSSGFAGGEGAEQDETKSLGDFAIQMRNGSEGRKRLQDVYDVKATMTEADATSAGYMVPESNLGRIDDKVKLQSAIPMLVNPRPVSTPTGYMLGMRVDVVPTAGVGDTAEASGAKSTKRGETVAATETVFETRRLAWNIQGSAISGIIKVSEELANDAPFVEAEIIDTISTVEAAKMEYFVLKGNGTNEPLGISAWGGTVTQVADTTGSFTLADVKAMMSKMLPASLATAYWIMHPSSLPDFLSLGEGVTDIFIQDNLAAAAPVNLYGRPVLLSQHMPQKGNDGAVLLADLSSWMSFNLGGLSIKFSRDRYFDDAIVAWRFDRRLDGKPSLPGAVTLADPQGSFQQSSFVKLLNT